VKLFLHEDCVWGTLEGPCSPDLLKALDKALSFYEPGFRFTPAYKRHVWDGKKHLFDPKQKAFPAGLSYRVIATLKEFLGDDYALDVQDARPPGPFEDAIAIPAETVRLHGVDLFSDQREMIKAATTNLRGCLCLATGFGKTEVAAGVLKAASRRRGLFLVNKKGLMAQTADRFEDRLQERVGRLGGGYRDTSRRVTVATVQTVYQHLKSLTEFLDEQQVVIYDEAHTIAPGMSFPVLQAVHAPVRLGLSATIKEASRRMAVEAFLGPILVESGAKELIAAGRATPARVRMIRVGGFVEEQTYDEIYDKGIVYNRSRNAAIVQAVEEQLHLGRRVLTLVVRIDHGYALAASLACPFLHGGSSLDEIQDAKKKIANGTLDCVVASTIFDFGQDIPTIDVLVLAGGGSSPLRTIQRMGRALRLAPGKTEALIIDFMDLSNDILRRHSEERRRTYERKGFPVEVVVQKQPV